MRIRRWQLAGLLVLVSGIQQLANAEPSFSPPGELEKGSGNGIREGSVYFQSMRFPLQNAPAYLNSQVYRPGGMHGAKGGQCDQSNYSYPWRDNFCERRGHKTPFCPTGTGHQGQDIRPASCHKNMHWTVAVEDGVIAHIGTYSVTLQTASGTLYRYLHLDMKDLAVEKMDKVKKGQKIGKVSNDFGGEKTTIHLHFEAKDTVLIGNKRQQVFLPPYASLIHSYKNLLNSKE